MQNSRRLRRRDPTASGSPRRSAGAATGRVASIGARSKTPLPQRRSSRHRQRPGRAGAADAWVGEPRQSSRKIRERLPGFGDLARDGKLRVLELSGEVLGKLALLDTPTKAADRRVRALPAQPDRAASDIDRTHRRSSAARATAVVPGSVEHPSSSSISTSFAP